MTTDKHLRCSFCGKSKESVKKFISGPNVYICNECISLCNEILAEDIESVLCRWCGTADSVVPVDAVLAGRRNNPPEKGVRPLCVYNPIHYQELPELFMDFIASLTGKSPSTTGAASEGALTKGPFNPVSPIIDMNNALVSAMLTRQPHFISAAGYVGPNFRVDHDISLIIPEIWSRMHIAERDPQKMIAEGLLEDCATIAGVPASSRCSGSSR